MATIDLTLKGKLFDKRFVTIGPDISQLSNGELRRLQRKIKREQKNKIPEAWATLGWKNPNKHFRSKGHIHFSKAGNYSSESATLELVKTLRDSAGEGLPDDFVLERYIDLSALDFQWNPEKFHIDKLPELRLTLFLNESEGALVYFDYGSKPDGASSDEGVDFIAPQPSNGEHTTKRDRLDYYFPIIPKRLVEALEHDAEGFTHKIGDLLETSRFVLKILTYQRGTGDSKKLVERGIKNLIKKLGKKNREKEISERNALQLFDAANNCFKKVESPSEIAFAKKTLLLVHGTFSNTHGSYSGLYEGVNGVPDTFLKKLIDENVYGQILGFDHRTLFDDAAENARALSIRLGHRRFEQPVSLIGTSRGGVVAYALSMKGYYSNFEVEKVVTVSAAFGVGYLEKVQNGLWLLNMLKKLSMVSMPVLAVVLQHSVEWFVNQPGLLQITSKKPGVEDTPLKHVMAANPKTDATQYLNIQTDWDKNTITGGWRGPKVILDWTIRLFLGKKHDWVVGYENQVHNIENQSLPPQHIDGVHTRQLLPGYSTPDPRAFMRSFLNS